MVTCKQLVYVLFCPTVNVVYALRNKTGIIAVLNVILCHVGFISLIKYSCECLSIMFNCQFVSVIIILLPCCNTMNFN